MSEMNKPQRTIKSFVKRTGRLTQGQQQALDKYATRFCIPYAAEQPLDLKATFNREAPCVLDIGFGNGFSLTTLAKQNPENNYLGIEVHTPGVGQALMHISEQAIENTRIIEHDAVDVLSHMLPANSIDTVQVFFPDPWPKKKHHKRRLLNESFVTLVLRVLKPNGLLHVATDWQPYAESVLALLSQIDALKNQAENGQYCSRPDDRPLTKFEKRGLNLGHSVFDLKFIKCAKTNSVKV